MIVSAKGYAGRGFGHAASEHFGATILRPAGKTEPATGGTAMDPPTDRIDLLDGSTTTSTGRPEPSPRSHGGVARKASPGERNPGRPQRPSTHAVEVAHRWRGLTRVADHQLAACRPIANGRSATSRS